MSSSNIERRIFFYAMRFLSHDREITNFLPIFQHINGLDYDDASRYFRLSSGNARSMDIPQVKFPLQGIFGTTRRKDLPLSDEKGKKKPLQLNQGAGLYEPIHFMIFPTRFTSPTSNRSYFAGVFEFNFHGPRPRGVQSYLETKASQLVDTVEMIPLPRPDAIDVSKFSEIHVLKLGIFRDHADVTKYLDDSLPDAVRSLADISDADVIEITLKASRIGKRNLLPKIKNRLTNWARREDVKNGVTHAKVIGKPDMDSATTEVDLLEELLMVETTVARTREDYDAVDDTAIFEKIERAFNSHREDIRRAIGNVDTDRMNE